MPDQVAISAHGPRAGTIEAYACALATGADYVEFDIRRPAEAVAMRASVRPGASPGA